MFAEAVGKSKKPVCMPLSGAVGSFLEELVGNKCECKEIKCRSQGEEMCHFQVKISR
ncbi:MAG: V4R domain-containing protein [Aquificota bacterium]|nr:V4R domain-containing protein [Aquificota bacterium]